MAITTNIKNFPATHGKEGGSGGGVTYIMGGSNSGIGSSLTLNSITATTGQIDDLSGKTLHYNEAEFIYMQTGNGVIGKLRGDEINYDSGRISDLYSDNIKAGKITTDDLEATKAWIETLNSKYITTEYLTVTKQAHFFELIIDKIKSVGGQIILTAANCIVDYAKAVKNINSTAFDNYWTNLDHANVPAYDVFFLATDGSGRKVTNDWRVNDQAICQSFNNVSEGVNYDVSNKYYWRLVKNILPDRYMNLNTGEMTSDSNVATVNTVNINTPLIKLTDVNDDEQTVNMGWNTTAQNIDGVVTGVTWTQTSGGTEAVTIGTMTTMNTVFGIQLKPIAGTTLASATPETFQMRSTNARLSIGFYYTDNTSEYFPAPAEPQSTWNYTLTTNTPIEAVVITNADEVEWKLVHGIRLSNNLTNNECDEMLNGYASIPSQGDNLVQLGYRYNAYQESDPLYDVPRSSAIIIAAYHTPDTGLTPPSYAQYTNITDFNLASHRGTFIDANRSRFIGELYVDSNTSVQDYVAQHAGGTVYTHTAYANSADGQTDFTKTPAAGTTYNYLGICNNSTESDASLTYRDYTWSYIPSGAIGPQGAAGESYKLAAVLENVPIDNNGNLRISLTYNIIHNTGSTAEVIQAGTSTGFKVQFRPIRTQSITNTWTDLSVNTTAPSFNNGGDPYETNWHGRQDHITHIEVRLIGPNSVIFDKRVVYAQLTPGATLSITDQITATVQGCRTDIDTNTNAISTLNQQFDSISATVTSHSTSIGNLEDDVAHNTTDIANLNIRADGISSQVSNYCGVQLINLYGWTKADHTPAVYDDEYQGYDITHSVWNGNDYYDIYSNVVKLKQGEKYVFSFYSEFNPHISVAYSATNKLPVDFNSYVTTVRYTDLQDTYYDNPRIYYTFTATADAYYVIDASMQDEELTSAFYRPQLELGTVPSQFDINAQMLSSQIVQTAENIILQVGNCGIDIDNRQITLNGNTLINGNLTLNQADQGFTLQGIGGTTLITPQSIGTYNQFIQRTAIDYTVENIQTAWLNKDTETINSQTTTFYRSYFRYTNTIGKVKQGATITLNNLSYSYMNDGSSINSSYATIDNTTWSVYEDGIFKQAITFNIGGTATYTATSDCIISIQNYVVIKFYRINNEQKEVQGTLRYHVNVPINDAFTMIGYDGIGSNFGNNRTVYIGSEGTYIKYGNAGFKITDDIIQKMDSNGNWVGLDAKKVTIMPNLKNYTLGDTDELIIGNNTMTSDRYLYLPSTTYAGRTIYVKEYRNGAQIYVSCDNKIMPSNDYTPVSTVTVNNSSNMFIFDGTYWIHFNCS